MKTTCSLVMVTLLFLCMGYLGSNSDLKKADVESRVVIPGFQSIIDSAEVKGSVLIYVLQKNIYYSNDFNWAKVGRLPASTYKIPHSIIALETGVVAGEDSIQKWDGNKKFVKAWEQDLSFTDAFRFSCVPCYQAIARKIGEVRMNRFLARLKFGNMKVDSSNIDVFWLKGESKITQFQQIDFLKRLQNSRLPISKNTARIVKKIMIIERKKNYVLRGKTGWAVRDGNNNGWFVGYMEQGENVFFFAVNINPKGKFNMKLFSKIRMEITYSALKHLKIIK